MSEKLFDLSGRVAIVTGASRGLGRYAARALAHAGADLAVTSRSAARLQDTVSEIEEIGRQALALELDVNHVPAIDAMVEKAVAEYGKVDILVNNAGRNLRKPAVEITEEDWHYVVDTNLKGEFFVAQAVAKRMIPRGYGRIINIGSVTTVFGYAGVTPYCASRGGVKQMTMSLADDWGKHGITVNCLSPGWFRTEQTEQLYQNEAWVEYLTERIPLNRPGKPNDLDGAVVFLASEASEYITGQTLLVDGGITTGSTKATVEES
jgi:NAD(P)-dependent dehydrogenase (short-subunit alcohol dehydrogenase family)